MHPPYRPGPQQHERVVHNKSCEGRKFYHFHFLILFSCPTSSSSPCSPLVLLTSTLRMNYDERIREAILLRCISFQPYLSLPPSPTLSLTTLSFSIFFLFLLSGLPLISLFITVWSHSKSEGKHSITRRGRTDYAPLHQATRPNFWYRSFGWYNLSPSPLPPLSLPSPSPLPPPPPTPSHPLPFLSSSLGNSVYVDRKFLSKYALLVYFYFNFIFIVILFSFLLYSSPFSLFLSSSITLITKDTCQSLMSTCTTG